MEGRKIVVVVEDVEAARIALQWALRNYLRYGDFITLLHVFSSSSSSRNNNNNSKKMRHLRLKGYQLALSFKDICNSFFNTNIEIVVTEGDEEGAKIADMVTQIGAFALVLGLHDRSFLYRLAMMAHSDVVNKLNCKVLAIKQPSDSPTALKNRPKSKLKARPQVVLHTSTTIMDLSQIEISTLEVPYIAPPKIPYKVCPDPYAIIWRWRKSRRKNDPSTDTSL
ncbi:Adenine nucleotide alpha hydrolases-like superfamily protein [Euphorbia peplus]|nr:Adenine nucleotide alpha hydrolases-like superfamily protein [Euphorbia peplus]